jgi:AhpD family alkylhydroperoxidase
MSWTARHAALKTDIKALHAAIPDVARAFGAIGKAVKTDGALDLKTKELIAVGIAVADRCEPCIVFHIEALRNAGATRAELADALGMAVQMGGGPSLMYSAKALACWDELAAVTATTAE